VSHALGLTLAGVSHAYGTVTVVDGVSLAVGRGEIVCLLGPSGCGKSTVLRIAAGLERLQAGTVSIDGRVVADTRTAVPPERRGVGLVFQDFALFPHLSVLDNVAFGLARRSPERRYAAAREALDKVALGDLAPAFPHTLSGGEQQRVALARAMAPRPGVMLLDEPFSDLDVRLRDAVREHTLAVLKAAGTPTLLVTHDPEEAMRMADTIALMRAGRIVQAGTPAQVYAQPNDAFVAKFLSDSNELQGVVKGRSIATPLGPLSADGLGEGTGVDVLVRPEALRIGDAAGAGLAARVVSARVLGPYSLVEIAIDAAGAALVARVTGSAAPEPGSAVTVHLDPSQVFIFPRAPDSDGEASDRRGVARI
jgi:iron(III) transport system ATP-binding protein